MTIRKDGGAASLDARVEAGDWADALGDPVALATQCHAAAADIDPMAAGGFDLLFTDDARLAELNAAHRGREGPTNVLSFPSGAQDTGFLGDVALAYETCAREAARDGKSITAHAAHLIVHGLLHLIGYDHETDDEATVMERLETSILARLGVDDPYAGDKAGAAFSSKGESLK
ncbi:MAG: rRNA maturation RNase YbeY [Pseudomonadota bacterium]